MRHFLSGCADSTRGMAFTPFRHTQRRGVSTALRQHRPSQLLGVGTPIGLLQPLCTGSPVGNVAPRRQNQAPGKALLLQIGDLLVSARLLASPVHIGVRVMYLS